MQITLRRFLLGRTGKETFWRSVWTVTLAFGLALSADAGTVTLRSGNGSIGGTDSLIRFLDGPASADFAALTAANFTSAQTGPAASIIIPNGAWTSTLVEDPSAQWIGDNAGAATGGNTALFAESFSLPNPIISASITVHFLVDNTLGSATNSGIFLNGTAVSPVPAQGGFSTETAYSNAGIGSLLHQGTNFIYFDEVNLGGPAGLIYTATITTVDGTSGAPEPSTFGLLGGGLLLLAAGRRWLRGHTQLR